MPHNRYRMTPLPICAISLVALGCAADSEASYWERRATFTSELLLTDSAPGGAEPAMFGNYGTARQTAPP